MSHFNLRMPVEFRLRPWVRAEALAWPDLYWTPMSGFPVRAVEREWLAEFLSTLAGELSQDGLVPLCFLEAAVIQGPLEQAFLAEARDLTPLPGFCRRLWDEPPAAPPAEVIDRIRGQQQPFSYDLFVRGHAYWVDPPDFRSFCLRFGGYGGLIVLFAAAPQAEDPLAAVPAAFFENPFVKNLTRGVDIRREMRQMQRMQDPRMAAVKPVLARGWEGRVDVEKVFFLIPKLKSLDYFSVERPVLESVMQTFPVCFFESPPDEGVLLSVATPFADRLSALMHQVRAVFRDRPAGENR